MVCTVKLLSAVSEPTMVVIFWQGLELGFRVPPPFYAFPWMALSYSSAAGFQMVELELLD